MFSKRCRQVNCSTKEYELCCNISVTITDINKVNNNKWLITCHKRFWSSLLPSAMNLVWLSFRILLSPSTRCVTLTSGKPICFVQLDINVFTSCKTFLQFTLIANLQINILLRLTSRSSSFCHISFLFVIPQRSIWFYLCDEVKMKQRSRRNN